MQDRKMKEDQKEQRMSVQDQKMQDRKCVTELNIEISKPIQ